MVDAAPSNATLRQLRYVEYANRTRGNRRIRDKGGGQGAERILPDRRVLCRLRPSPCHVSPVCP